MLVCSLVFAMQKKNRQKEQQKGKELCCVSKEADDEDDEKEIDEYEDDVEGYTPGRIEKR